MSAKTVLVAGVACLILAGCSCNPPASTPAGRASAAAQTSRPESTVGPSAQATVSSGSSTNTAPALPDDGKLFIPFELKATTLDSAGARSLTDRVARIKQAKKVVVVGYCDHKEPKARDTAVIRANSVRRELLKLGVKSRFISVRYMTDQPRHGVEVRYAY